MAVVDRKSVGKPRFRSDHTSWFAAPVKTRMRGIRSIGSSGGSADDSLSRWNHTLLERSALASLTLVAGSAGRTTLPVGSIPAVALLNDAVASCPSTHLLTSWFSVRTAVGESTTMA